MVSEEREINWNERTLALKELAYRDDSFDYEIDVSGIYTDGNVFYYISASGCSCWEGEGYEIEFSDFESLVAYLMGDMEGRNYLSLNGSKALIQQAQEIMSMGRWG